MEHVCVVKRLGSLPYEAAWALQRELAAKVAARAHPPALLLLEHPHTYTLGRRGEAAHLLWDRDELSRRGITVLEVDRGGDITYHGPGQLVCYPILPLAEPGWTGERLPQADYVGYIRKLEQALILALARFGVAAGQVSGKTGVWVQADAASRCTRCDPAVKQPAAKIASIGVKVDARGVSQHGFALNVRTDPDYWAGIVPCGLDGVTMANLDNLLGERAPGMRAVEDAVVAAFGEVFGFEMREEAGTKTGLRASDG